MPGVVVGAVPTTQFALTQKTVWCASCTHPSRWARPSPASCTLTIGEARRHDLALAARRQLRWLQQTADVLRAAGAPLLSQEEAEVLGDPHSVYEGSLPHGEELAKTCSKLRLAQQLLTAGGWDWSPKQHSKSPAAFRAAARTLLLINRHRGFPIGASTAGGAAGDVAGAAVGAAAAAAAAGRRVRQRTRQERGSAAAAAMGSGSIGDHMQSKGGQAQHEQQQGQQAQQAQRVMLEPELLLSVLRFASADGAAWAAATIAHTPDEVQPWGLQPCYGGGYW
ncbi:hypothetical protein ABPG75_002219 [Micractinium tetrahymenae]